VLVLDQGKLLENGEPHDLLQKQSGIFTGMVEQTGPGSSLYLRDVARQASFSRAAARSVTAQQMHAARLRQESEVLGQGYLGRPVIGTISESDMALPEYGPGADEDGNGTYRRVGSMLDATRYITEVGSGLCLGCWLLPCSKLLGQGLLNQ
jgi:hypothetical protein